MMSRPTIVLISGAFHVASHMSLLQAELAKAAYPCIARGLRTPGAPDLEIADDVKYLKDQVLHPLIIEQRKDVVLYLHSYAGFPGSAAIGGLSKEERVAKGERGGIVGLIYQCAFIPHEGNALVKMLGGEYPEWQAPNIKAGLINVLDPRNTFYHDVPETTAIEASNALLGQSLQSFNSKIGPVYYAGKAFDGRRLYIHTEQDQALPPFVQDIFVVNSGCEWEVKRIATSHSPFLSDPSIITEIIENAVSGFSATY